MCGIAGFALRQPAPWGKPIVTDMTDAIAHRGPDSDGHLSSPDQRVWLGFRRLAIRDLDPRANQPMLSASGRTAIIFNGEIYNSAELAAKHCRAHTLRTTGDTEVFLEAFERSGSAIFEQANGMFAAAFLDLLSGEVTLVRDRMGKKPLFLHETPSGFAFGSELRAFRRFGLQPDPSATNLTPMQHDELAGADLRRVAKECVRRREVTKVQIQRQRRRIRLQSKTAKRS